LAQRPDPFCRYASRNELTDSAKPWASLLNSWLNRATDEQLVRRQGTGRRNDPYRYRLPNADDAYWDRGELPPLPGAGVW
jgi:hypothetical protein